MTQEKKKITPLSRHQQAVMSHPHFKHVQFLYGMVHPRLERFFGYDPENMRALPIPDNLRVSQRFVAFYWPYKFTYDDGLISGTGEWAPFLLFKDHIHVWPWLSKYNFGADDAEPDHGLILDREERKLYVAPMHLVREFLRAQRWAFIRAFNESLPEQEEDAPLPDPVEMKPEDLKKLLEGFKAVNVNTPEFQAQVRLNMQKSAREYQELSEWLEHPSTATK